MEHALTSIAALIFVIGLILFISFIMRRYAVDKLSISKINGTKRLSVIEIKIIDARNRLIIIKCDEKEHLILIGADGNNMVIDKGIISTTS